MPGLLADGEQFELFAQDAVVALLRLLDMAQVRVEVFLRKECGTVEALQLLAAGVVLPVRAGDAQQLERADLAGVWDVRAAAQVDELALAVETDRRIFLQFLVDVFHLQRLIQVGDELPAVGDASLESLERLGRGDDLFHFGFDLGEVFLLDRSGRVDVVVKAVVGGRAERELSAGEQAHDRPGHDVGGRVPQHVEGVAVFVGQDLERDFLGASRVSGESNLAVEVDDLVIHLRGDCGLGEPLANALGNLPRGGPERDLAGGTIR